MPSYMQPQSSEQHPPPPEERPPVARLASYGIAPLSSIPAGAADGQGVQHSTLGPSQHSRIQQHVPSPTGHEQAGFGSPGEARRSHGEWYPPQQHQLNHYYQQQQQQQSRHHGYSRPLSDDRAEGVKRLRSEHSHHPLQAPTSYSAYSSAPLHNGVAPAITSSPTPPMSVIPAGSAASCESPHRMAPARLQMRSESVSISPAPSSSGHAGPRIPASAVAAAPSGAPLHSPPTEPLNGDHRPRQHAQEEHDDASQHGDDHAGQYHQHGEGEGEGDGEGDGDEGDAGLEPAGVGSGGSASRREQKRRLNQACLLCRRKKIKCDSVQPSCSNCQRRGIQCIYPEVRKRGRPPRMYTFADFALPGQPLPPELQGIANVHASAMLPAGMGRAAGLGPSGASTPAHARSEHGASPALPPLSVAVDPMLLPTPPLGVDQAVLDLFEHVAPALPIVHRQTLVQRIRDRSLTLPLWLAIHAVAARFDAQQSHGHSHAPSMSHHALGAGYAEKTHAILANRLAHRPPRPVWGRNERGRMVVARDAAAPELGGGPSRREAVELLQTHVLLSVYYAGNGEAELAGETHAAAVRMAQRMGVHLLDDPARLPDAGAIFNPAAAQRQRQRAPRSACVEHETLRRIWWALFVLDRAYYVGAASPRMVHVAAFRVRLPCSDLEWDAMRAPPPASEAPRHHLQPPPPGLMVRTFREAVMHSASAEQAASEIAATPSADAGAYRRAAALAGLVDGVMDLADDIRALASPPLLEGAELLAPAIGAAAPGRSATAAWLAPAPGPAPGGRALRGWHAPAVSAAWPPDWRARMRVLRERAAALEAQFTAWYSAMPIAQHARRPHVYSQLPLQDRITYFHQQIAYYGGVIQLHSLVVMAHGLLLTDAPDDAPAAFGPAALASMLWRSLMGMDTQAAFLEGQPQLHAAPQLHTAPPACEGDDPTYAPRQRLFGSHAAWTPRRQYGGSASFAPEGAYGESDSYGDGDGDDDSGASPVPLDEDGNSPEIVREELQRMVQAAWCRCTEAALAMSSAVKRATEVRKVASANPNTAYYDPTFRPQVLPPYRGDVVVAGEMRASPQQPHMSTMSMSMHGLAEGLARSPLPATTHSPYQPQQQQQHSKSPGTNAGMAVDSAAGPGQVIDDAAFFMRFSMFTSAAAYAGAYIHLQNLKVTPRWELAIRRHGEAVAKLGEAHGGVGANPLSMAEPRDMGMQDIGALPPPPPPPLPALPCTPDQAREGVKPLVRILEGIAPYWRVGGCVDRIRAMWREIEGSDLLPSAQVLASPSARIPGPPPMPQPPMPVPGLDAAQRHYWAQHQQYQQQQQQQQQQQRSPVPSHHHRHHHHHRPPSQSPPLPPIHHRQSSLSSMSIAALSNDSQSIHSRRLSAVGPPPPPPPPPSAMMMSSRQHIGLPPPPRP